uniref:Multiple inositol polyphosphate phosphatase 1 n=1 Tax=Daphnia galeata TaxID=27404 RepID=A0A8J2S616_9CRUS|nr:unnamed protein product [Daphnia galeata]
MFIQQRSRVRKQEKDRLREWNWSMEADEKLERAKLCKEKGTNHFKTAKYALANEQYAKIVTLLEFEKCSKRRESFRAGAAYACSISQSGHVLLYWASTSRRKPSRILRRFFSLIQTTRQRAANQVVICNARIRQQREKNKTLYSSIFNKMAENDRQVRQVNSCCADIASPNFYFATKTSYKFIKNTNTDEITLPGCEAVQMWLFSRHGTRYPRNDPEPGGEDFRAVQGREMELDALTQQMPILRDAVIQNHLSGRGELCAEDLQNLRDWTIDIPPELEEKLAPSGEEEMHDIGQRYTARLPG